MRGGGSHQGFESSHGAEGKAITGMPATIRVREIGSVDGAVEAHIGVAAVNLQAEMLGAPEGMYLIQQSLIKSVGRIHRFG